MNIPKSLQPFALGLFLAAFATTGASAQLSNGLLNYWPLDGDATDNAPSVPGSSGTTTDNGTINGSVTFVAGQPGFGQAGSFPGGAGNNITIPDPSAGTDDIDRSGADLSISVWFQLTNRDSGWQALVAHGEGTDYRVAVRGSVNPIPMAYAGGGASSDIETGATVGAGPAGDGLWHHLVATTEGSVTNLYLDGVLEATGGTGAINENGQNLLCIGCNPTNGREWNGLIDDVAMWDRALSLAEVEQIFNGGLALSALIDPNDDDGDGLPNAWEIANGLDPLPPNGALGDDGATGDPDGDLSNNEDEYANSTDPQNPDTDGDFSTDGAEASNNTDPRDADSDDDGLLDGHETNGGAMSYMSPTDTGSDPNALDTDLDGINDGVEVANGSDPTDGASVPLVSALPIIDDFEDNLLNTIDWTAITGTISQDATGGAFGGTISETGGGINIGARAHLHTTEEFDPEVVGGIRIRGEWTFNNADDFLQLLTRSDAMPTLAWGETNSGVEFIANAGSEQIVIRSRNADHTVSDVLVSGPLVINPGTPYLFEAVDDGAGNLSFIVTEKADAANSGVVTAQLVDSGISASNFIVLHNREGGRSSRLEEITIEALVDSDTDGLPDYWELDNFGDLTQGANDDTLDTDGLTNLQEYQILTDPNSDDTDGDMALDGEENGDGNFVSVAMRGTHPRIADTDGDGLLDGVEDNTGVFVGPTSTGTDPFLADTDSDLMSDPDEIARGRDPSDPTDANSGLSLGLLAYWTFDETLEDIAHSGVPSDSFVADDGSFTGPATDVAYSSAADALLGSASLEQNGGDGWVTVASSADTLHGDGDTISISAWFQVASFDNNWQALIVHGEGSQYRVARSDNTDNLAYAGGVGDITAPLAINDGTWHHVVAISEAGVNTRLYIDGTERITGGMPNITDIGDPNLNVVPDLFIGANPERAGREWNGLIDDMAIWDRALTPAEVTEINTAGTSGESLQVLLGGGAPIEITDIDYDQVSGSFTVTWTSTPGSPYAIYWSPDLADWEADVDDGLTGGAGTTTSETFPHPDPLLDRIFFRVEPPRN